MDSRLASDFIIKTSKKHLVNNLLPQIEAAGLKVTGRSEPDHLVEMIELSDHPWFIACQFHPEFTSTPRDGHPLFTGFIRAAKAYQEKSDAGMWF